MLTEEGKPIAPPASPAVGEEITLVRARSNVAVVPLESAACEIQAEVAVRVSVIVTWTVVLDPGAMTQKTLKGIPIVSRVPRWVRTGAGSAGSKPRAQRGA